LPSRSANKDLSPKKDTYETELSQWEMSARLENCDLEESSSRDYLEVRGTLEKQQENQEEYFRSCCTFCLHSAWTYLRCPWWHAVYFLQDYE